MNDIVRRYARLQVPRYTSYPTAAEFTADVGAADQRRWLKSMDTREAVSVYLHVPYCRELCRFPATNTAISHANYDILRRLPRAHMGRDSGP